MKGEDGDTDNEEAAATRSTTQLTPLPPSVPPPTTWTPPSPSFSLLFSYLTRRDAFTLLTPAIAVSMIEGGIAPFMTTVIGEVFDALARFPLSTLPPDQAKHQLLHDIGINAVKLVGLAAGTLMLSSVMATLWMWVGERNALRLRKAIYRSVTHREMEWFDLKMGQDEGAGGTGEQEEGDTGAGGMMSRFSRDTDDVRQATAINAGMLIQYATTFFACLILALVESWSLTLVILSSIPLLIFVQGLSQALATPFYHVERSRSASAGTRIERAVTSIATVKAFNAQLREHQAVEALVQAGRAAYKRCAAVWGVTAGITQFILFAMFVQGFWYGSKLVRDGKSSPGKVMAVFWACLIASSNLQLCIPLLVILTKGKAAMVSLDTLINKPVPSRAAATATSPTARAIPIHHHHSEKTMMKVIPSGRCHGAFSLHNVRFSYPSRLSVPVLSIDDMYLPHGETTFIVGGSGSGKSTISQLLLRLYDLDSPGSGTILFDDNDLAHLDRSYTRQHVAAVSQNCILFDMTVHENVAMGLACAGGVGRQATREEVEKACMAALMHEFVRDLPEGYNTRLGAGGAALSGGQRQRLAIARAMLRDPTVLILDEATSALDATSRVLVTEAIKTWRKNKTTIVITHDLAQIGPEDFVYVLKNGQVVERGFREELEKGHGIGEFKRMGDTQNDGENDRPSSDGDLYYDAAEEEEHGLTEVVTSNLARASSLAFQSWGVGGTTEAASRTRSSIDAAAPGARTWMFDAIADLTNEVPSSEVRQAAQVRASKAIYPSPGAGVVRSEGRRSSMQKKLSIIVHERSGSIKKSRTSFQLGRPLPAAIKTGRHQLRESKSQSLQFEPISPPPDQTTMWSAREKAGDLEDDEDFERYKDAMRATGNAAGAKRMGPQGALRVRRSQRDLHDAQLQQAPVVVPSVPSLTGITKQFFPTLQNKGIIFIGIIICVINGAMTPLFSVALSQLMAQVGEGATNVGRVHYWGVIVLLVALGDGLSAGLKFFIMENAAMAWITSLRSKAYGLILRQDKSYFDNSDEHGAERIVQMIVKDGDDARLLIATVLSQTVVVITMVSTGLIWALFRGWQLTLVGFALAPVFALAMLGQSVLVGKFELRSKRARERVEKRYFDTVSSIRAIRSMALEEVFFEQFEESATEALNAGVRGAFVAGGGYGVANALVYLAQAVLFYVGAAMMAKGTYSYLSLLEVLNLVVFTVSIASQMLTFIPRVAKANQAAADFGTILALEAIPTRESQGHQTFPIRGDITFERVNFAYPQRSDAPILRQLSFTIRDSECVAIVGASGSGKSTIAALLQRLYEPSSGTIAFDRRFQLKDVDAAWLRSHVAVVSQHPALFDASIKDNILYGVENPDSVPLYEVERAARDANLDDVIAGLPKGYDTHLGENAALISGGQAQRIQLARALVNGKANVLILDEFTSALDVDNQESLMSTVMNIKEGRTTVIVTHKLPVMRRCDRILVVSEGAIVEEGSYDALMTNRGHFWTLASAGEWAD